MVKDSNITEAKLFQDILEKAKNAKADYSPLSAPLGNPTEKISEGVALEVSDYFANELLPFTKILENASNKLSKTLNFDMHELFKQVALGSEAVVNSGEVILKKLPKATNGKVKELFRYILWPWIKNSYFVNRGLLKPHGFPGDYVIVEAMYDGNPQSLGLGYIYDLIFLQTQLCRGLRNRKDQMKQIISNYLSQNIGKSLSILNVGCGGSRELREISLPNEGKGLDVYLMDFDSRATDYSLAGLSPQAPKAVLSPLNIDVREVISKNGIAQIKPDSIDLIYSIGLFDYLPDRVLTQLLQKLLNALKQDGVLIFAHKDYTVYDPKIADWFCDWKYYPRTQADIEQILKTINIDPQKVAFSRERDGYIFFAEVFKSTPVNK